jgi:hypothetical protein
MNKETLLYSLFIPRAFLTYSNCQYSFIDQPGLLFLSSNLVNWALGVSILLATATVEDTLSGGLVLVRVDSSGSAVSGVSDSLLELLGGRLGVVGGLK